MTILYPVLREPGQRGGGGGGVWTPAQLGSRLLVWHDPADITTQWQDSARTTGAAVGQPVGSSRDKATILGTKYLQQATGASRPVLRLDSSGYAYWDHDGLDDSLASDAAVDLTGYTGLTVCVGVRKDSDAAIGVVIELGPQSTSTDNTFGMFAPVGSSTTMGCRLRGVTTVAGYTNTPYTSPVAKVMTGLFNLTAATFAGACVMRYDGVADVSGAVSAVPSGTVFANQSLFTGRRNNATSPLVGRIYQVVIAAGILAGAELTNLERFVGARMGIAL